MPVISITICVTVNPFCIAWAVACLPLGRLGGEIVTETSAVVDVDTTGADFPAEPVREFERLAEWEFKNMKTEITNALSILRMTDEEVVNASTMKSIAQYL